MDHSPIDVDSVDHALTTTRAVRLRLDLEREVDNQIIYDCIDIAEQAPSGGNQGSRRWIVVRDPAIKERIAVPCGNQKHIVACPVFLAFLADLTRIEG